MFTTKYVLFIIVVVMSMFVQSLVGFGGNPIAMPFCVLLVGVGLAKPVLTILAAFIGIAVTLKEIRHINWKELAKMSAVMLIGLVFGIWVFKAVELDFLLIIYAVVIIGIGIKKLFFPAKKEANSIVQYTALGLAGLMQGLFVSGGSFLAVYSVARLKNKEEFRATSNAIWGVLNSVLIITYIFDGTMTKEVVLSSVICIVPTLIFAWLAGILAKKINQQTFIKITYVILILSGTVLLVSNL